MWKYIYIYIYIEIIIVHSNMLLAMKLAINKYLMDCTSLVAFNCYSNWFIGRRRRRWRRCLYYKRSRCVAAAVALRLTHDRKESKADSERERERNWANRCDSILLCSSSSTHAHTHARTPAAQLTRRACAHVCVPIKHWQEFAAI